MERSIGRASTLFGTIKLSWTRCGTKQTWLSFNRNKNSLANPSLPRNQCRHIWPTRKIDDRIFERFTRTCPTKTWPSSSLKSSTAFLMQKRIDTRTSILLECGSIRKIWSPFEGEMCQLSRACLEADHLRPADKPHPYQRYCQDTTVFRLHRLLSSLVPLFRHRWGPFHPLTTTSRLFPHSVVGVMSREGQRHWRSCKRITKEHCEIIMPILLDVFQLIVES